MASESSVATFSSIDPDLEMSQDDFIVMGGLMQKTSRQSTPRKAGGGTVELSLRGRLALAKVAATKAGDLILASMRARDTANVQMDFETKASVVDPVTEARPCSPDNHCLHSPRVHKPVSSTVDNKARVQKRLTRRVSDSSSS